MLLNLELSSNRKSTVLGESKKGRVSFNYLENQQRKKNLLLDPNPQTDKVYIT